MRQNEIENTNISDMNDMIQFQRANETNVRKEYLQIVEKVLYQELQKVMQ